MSKNILRCDLCRQDYCGDCVDLDTECEECGIQTCGERRCLSNCKECNMNTCDNCENNHKLVHEEAENEESELI